MIRRWSMGHIRQGCYFTMTHSLINRIDRVEPHTNLPTRHVIHPSINHRQKFIHLCDWNTHMSLSHFWCQNPKINSLKGKTQIRTVAHKVWALNGIDTWRLNLALTFHKSWQLLSGLLQATSHAILLQRRAKNVHRLLFVTQPGIASQVSNSKTT